MPYKCIFNDIYLFVCMYAQYGFVNSALEKLICRRFGREKWEEVK